MWNFHVFYFADVDFRKSTWISMKTKKTSKLMIFFVIRLFLIIFHVFDVELYFYVLYFADVDVLISHPASRIPLPHPASHVPHPHLRIPYPPPASASRSRFRVSDPASRIPLPHLTYNPLPHLASA